MQIYALIHNTDNQNFTVQLSSFPKPKIWERPELHLFSFELCSITQRLLCICYSKMRFTNIHFNIVRLLTRLIILVVLKLYVPMWIVSTSFCVIFSFLCRILASSQFYEGDIWITVWFKIPTTIHLEAEGNIVKNALDCNNSCISTCRRFKSQSYFPPRDSRGFGFYVKNQVPWSAWALII